MTRAYPQCPKCESDMTWLRAICVDCGGGPMCPACYRIHQCLVGRKAIRDGAPEHGSQEGDDGNRAEPLRLTEP